VVEQLAEAWHSLWEACRRLDDETLSAIPVCRLWLERWNPSLDADEMIREIFKTLVGQQPLNGLAEISWSSSAQMFEACVNRYLRSLPAPLQAPEAPDQHRNRFAY